MFTAEQLKSHQARVFTDAPTEVLTYNGTNYNALRMEGEFERDWDAGGQVTQRKIDVAIERGAIDGNIPAEGDQVVFDGETLRVGLVNWEDKSASVILTLEHTLTRA